VSPCLPCAPWVPWVVAGRDGQRGDQVGPRPVLLAGSAGRPPPPADHALEADARARLEVKVELANEPLAVGKPSRPQLGEEFVVRALQRSGGPLTFFLVATRHTVAHPSPRVPVFYGNGPPFYGDLSPLLLAYGTLPGLVRGQWRSLRRRVRRAANNPSDKDLHQIRIGAKQLRYAAEAAAPEMGKRAKKTAKASEKLQTVLADHHDAVGATEWLGCVATGPSGIEAADRTGGSKDLQDLPSALTRDG
jgi:CHAD domain